MRSKKLPEGWRKAKLGKIVSMIIDRRGITPNKLGGEWSKKGIPVLSAKNIKQGRIINENNIRYVKRELYEKWMPEKLETEDILMTSEAPLGELFYLKEKADYCLGQRLFALRSNKSIMNPKFFYYFLQSPQGKHELIRRISGTAAEGIRQVELRQIEIVFPQDINEQRRIADILSSLDDKIELNNKINQTLEQMAQAIFREWFVKFRFPGWEKVEFVDSELGKIPEGWEVKPLTEIVTVNPRIYLKKGSITPYVEMSDLSTKGMWFTSKRNQEYKGGSKFQNGDTLLARITPSLEHGKIGYVNCLQKNGVGFGSTEFIVFRPPNSNWREFIYLLARSYRLKDFAIQNMFGTSGRQRVPVNCFENFTIPVPPEEIIKEFHQIAEPMFVQIRINSVENQKLATIRDLLLPKLMRGEIRVNS